MDELISGLLVLMVAAAAVALYVAVAGAAALALAAMASVDAVGYCLWRLTSILRLALRTRGGDRRSACPPEPAFEIYFGRPLIRDYAAGLRVVAGEMVRQASGRRDDAFNRFEGAMLPLAFGIALGAYVGAALGLLAGGIVAALLGAAVVLLGGTVWMGGRALQAMERARRRLRGAHFDCPGCHERSALPVYVCPSCGARHRQLLPGRWGIRRRRCACDRAVLPTLESTGRHSVAAECPRCQFPMPGAGGVVPELPIPIVGGVTSGKSAFVASMLVALEERAAAGQTSLGVVEASRAAFAQLTSDLKGGRVPAKTQLRHRTPAVVAEVRAGDRRAALLYAHDVAGELFQHGDRVRESSYVARARGAMFVLDPFSLGPVASELAREHPEDVAAVRGSTDSPQSVAERFVHALRESGRKDVGSLPVAVVVTKADALRDGRVAPGATGAAVRQWLEENGAGNVLRMLEAELGAVEVFAVSALGRVPDDSGAPFEPAGALSPLAWLLACNGVEMETGAVAAQTVTERLEGDDGAVLVPPRPAPALLAPRPYTPMARAVSVAAVLALALAATLSVGALLGSPPASDGFDRVPAASGDVSSGGTSSSDEGSTTGGDTTTGEAAGSGAPEDETPSAPQGFRIRSYSAFSVAVAKGWRTERREADQGSYIETRWRSPDDPDVYALVDYTPGFGGTAAEGARSVRKLYLGLDDYDERGFSASTAGGRSLWRWEFRRAGLQKVDYFLTACDTGYALLGSAPAAVFEDYRPTFAAMIRSFKASCES